ncbi:MAG: mechanosensitive ion channel protein MscS [Gallionellales bacterium RIFCSPLOWO2_12_FULL_59_22]|nr:MAG: mechanosensitive ion channel protein MscS [Gallionellales bacterium RIFCSPLOWO2_02_FULL_59_110]OGT04563.1 MAG: mechanosensitive ion channel protein MscS [Gallionellales bacterium RIFCSPLOWO2_02_58_13]OGT14338.1 MAG: mechanosensitive ion channel protein MscS [Gallionellales bacterium RIFCSPLOWO2_12_FULL_59_22]
MNIPDISYFREWLPAASTLLRVAIILLLAWVVLRLSRKLIRTFSAYMNARAATPEETRRIDTLARVFRYVATVAISLVAGMLALSELGISIAPILGAAGVVGIAVGFGAQSLIKDFFNGLFILVENQIRQGDVVEICGKTGVVEEVTLRYIQLRDFEGSVHFVPNSLITTVTNKSRGFAYAVIDVSIAYRESVDEAFAIMREVGALMRASEAFAARILEDIDIAGVDNWADSAVILRCRFKVIPLEQWSVRREFLRRLKEAFDARGIEIPYPHLTIYAGQDKQGNAPPLRVFHTGETP